MAIGGALFAFEILQGGLCVLPSLDHLYDARRFVSADVMADYNIGSLEFVVCQMFTPLLDAKKRSFESMRDCND